MTRHLPLTDEQLTQQELDDLARQDDPSAPPPFRRVIDAAKTVGLGALGGGVALVGALKNVKPVANLRDID